MFERQAERLRRQTMLLDVVLTVGALLGAYWFRETFVEQGAPLLPYLALLPVIAPLWVFLLMFFNGYRSPRTTPTVDLCWAVVRTVGTGLVLLLTLLFVLKIHYVSRAVVIAFGILDCLALIGVRLGTMWRFRSSLKRGDNFHKVLIVGSGARAGRLAQVVAERAGMGIHIVGYLDPDPTRLGQRLLESSVLGTLGDITRVLKEEVIDEVILAIPRSMIPEVEKVVRACEEEGVTVRLMADLFEVNVARMVLDEFHDVPLLTFEPVAQEEWKLFVKRLLDLTLSLSILPVVLPLMGIIALVIRLDSPGPALFRQYRVGLNKRQFRMFKFRTMVDGSHRQQAQLEALNEATGPNFKIADDPRITRIGRILRRTSLDELPQIFNVIPGELSLVGPRPLPLRDVNLFDRGIQRRRFSVKPGITCLWQVSGRSNLPFSRWLELDLRYIEHWSLTLDLKILLKTIPAVLRGSGAV